MVALGGFEPEGQLGDFDALSVDINAKEVVFQNGVADVDIQHTGRVKLTNLVIELNVKLFQHVKRSHQKCARAASGVTHAQGGQAGFPGFPKPVFGHIGGNCGLGSACFFVFAGFAPSLSIPCTRAKFGVDSGKSLRDDRS